MLQLVQSPSERIQRLIKNRCSDNTGHSSKPEVKVAEHGEDKRVIVGEESAEDAGGQASGESSIVSSFSSSPQDGNSRVVRVSRVGEGQAGIFVASSSSSTGRRDDKELMNGDIDDENIEHDDYAK